MLLILLLFVFLPVAAVWHKVHLPAEVLFKTGDRRELSCSVRSCPQDVKFVWMQLEDRPLYAITKNRDTESVLIFENVTRKHENTVLCKATCGKKTKQATVNIKVYSWPGNPVITGNDRLFVDEENLLNCEVSRAYPPEFLEVEWLYGDTVLHREEGEPGAENFKSSYRFRPSREDDGKVITCRATLNVDGIPPDEMTKTTSGHLRVLSPPMNTRIEASPQAVLKEGESVSIYCTSDGAPVERVELRRTMDSREAELKSSAGAETSATFDSVTLADSGLYVCEAFNEFGSQRVTLHLNIEAHSFEVELQPDGDMVAERDSSLGLSCQASGCPQPTFSWRRLTNMSTRGLTETSGLMSQLFLDPVELEDEGTYICEVTCGSVTKSKQTKVNVFSFPMNPVIEVSGPSLLGEMIHLTCSVRHVFPAHLFQILWTDGEREVRSESGTFSGHLQNLTSVLSYRMEGNDGQGRRISCRVFLEMHGVPDAQAVKTASTTLSLHYPPRGTKLTVSPPMDLRAGQSVSISCLSDSIPAGRVVLSRVLDGTETELKASDGVEASVVLPQVELQDSGRYVCEASNQYGSNRDSVEITVKAPPVDTSVEVLSASEVQEDQNITICCSSVSFPPPAVILRKLDNDSSIYSPSRSLINLTGNDTGLYQVNITSELGYEIFTFYVRGERSEPPPNWDDFVTPTICLACAAAVCGIVVYLWREKRKKKGLHNLTKSHLDTV